MIPRDPRMVRVENYLASVSRKSEVRIYATAAGTDPYTDPVGSV